MNTKVAKLPCILATAFALAGAGWSPYAHADEVTDWNEIMQTTVAGGNANAQSRAAAIVQLAVYEAVNAITREYQPYLGAIEAPVWASPEAAAVAAAHKSLVAQFPANATTLDLLRAASLASIPEGPAREAGIQAGEDAAAASLLLRINDGASTAGSTPYVPGTLPGDWQPAPPAFAAASQPGWGNVTPFAMESGAQFRLPPPPPINSGKYAHDFNEVKLVGRADSSFRPQDRTDVARFYAVTSPVQAWNSGARQISSLHGKTLSENARIFALLNMAIFDASVAAYDSKYYYNFWRPLTAIWGGALDQNHLTEADATWLPLINTPAFPSYPSAHATLSAAARTVLERVFGKNHIAITLSNTRLPGVVLHYSDWRQICDDIDDARVYGGIHFRFEQEAGSHQGQDVAKYILEHQLTHASD